MLMAAVSGVILRPKETCCVVGVKGVESLAIACDNFLRVPQGFVSGPGPSSREATCTSSSAVQMVSPSGRLRRFAIGFKSASVDGSMKLQSLMLRNSLLILTSLLALPAFRAAAQSKADAAQSKARQSKQQGYRPLPRKDAGLEPAQEGPEFLRRRQDWFFQPRAFPLGFIPQGARERALQQKDLMYQREGRLSLFVAHPGSGFLPPPSGPPSPSFSISPQPTT